MERALGFFLPACRERAGLSQGELADLMNRSQACICRYENNRRQPDLDTLKEWANVTNTREVIVAYLYGADGISMIDRILSPTRTA